MAKSIIALLLASAAAAEYNLTYLDVLWIPAPTLTLVSSDSIATTYELQCPTNLLTSTSPESSEYEGPFADSPPENAALISSDPVYYSTAFPAKTPTSLPKGCIPFTLFQGPETYGFHLTHSQSGLYTLNGDCSWTGVFTDVPITCDAEMKGTLYEVEFSSGTPTVFPQSQLRNWDRESVGYAVATVVEKSGAMTASVTMTSATRMGGERPAKETGVTTPGSKGAGSHASLPLGTMVMAGGAFAVGVTAWAL